jgi:hypothetical protein
VSLPSVFERPGAGLGWALQQDMTWKRDPAFDIPAAPEPPEPWNATTSTDFELPDDSDLRKEIPLWTGLFEYFPNALAETSRVSLLGNNKHNPGEDMHWARGKSMDQANCILRHMMDARFGHRDKDGMHHLAYAAWRALANLQLALEQERAGLPRWKP